MPYNDSDSGSEIKPVLKTEPVEDELPFNSYPHNSGSGSGIELVLKNEPVKDELPSNHSYPHNMSDSGSRIEPVIKKEPVEDELPLKCYPHNDWVNIVDKKEKHIVTPLWDSYDAEKKLSIFNLIQGRAGPCLNLLLIRVGHEHPYSVLLRNAAVWNRPLTFIWKKLSEKECVKGRNWLGSVKFDGIMLSKVSGPDKREVKKKVCDLAIYQLQKYFYTAEMHRGSMAEYYFERPVKTENKNSYTFELNKDLPTSDKSIVKFGERKVRSVRVNDVDNADLSDPEQKAKVYQKFTKIIDEYVQSENEERELVFVRQFKLSFYKEIQQYAQHSAGLKTRLLGSKVHRMLAVCKSDRFKWPNWKLVKSILIDNKIYLKGLTIVAPKSMKRPVLRATMKEHSV